MDPELLWKGFIIGIVVSIPLGPIGILCIQKTVNKNWRSGYTSGLGAATSDTIYSVVAGFSLTIIIDFIEQHEMLFQIIGAIILIFLGHHIYQSNPTKEIQKFKQKGATYFQDYFITLLLTLSNPLAVFIFLAVFASSGLALNLSQPLRALLIIGGIFLGASSWWLLLTGIVNLFRHKFTLRILFSVNKIVGIGVILFAVISFLYMQFIAG